MGDAGDELPRLLAPSMPGVGAQQRIGRYQIFKRLGTGGMANIYLGRATAKSGFEKWVAIKRPHSHLVGNPKIAKMIINEARLVSRLDHENICPIIDFDIDEIGPYIVMPHLHGEPFLSLIMYFANKPENRPIDLFVHVFMGACDGLHYAHEARDDDDRPLGVIHRDISPQNIFITFQGSTKILDFGVAKAIGYEGGSMSGALKGKYAYMAPEQVRGEMIDRRVDVFSLGVVMWEALAGARLFRRETDQQTILAVGSESAPPILSANSRVPARLAAIIDRALESNRQLRYSSALDLACELREYLLDRRAMFGSFDVARWMESTFPARAGIRHPLQAVTEIDEIYRDTVDEPAGDVEAYDAHLSIREALILDPADVETLGGVATIPNKMAHKKLAEANATLTDQIPVIQNIQMSQGSIDETSPLPLYERDVDKTPSTPGPRVIDSVDMTLAIVHVDSIAPTTTDDPAEDTRDDNQINAESTEERTDTAFPVVAWESPVNTLPMTLERAPTPVLIPPRRLESTTDKRADPLREPLSLRPEPLRPEPALAVIRKKVVQPVVHEPPPPWWSHKMVLLLMASVSLALAVLATSMILERCGNTKLPTVVDPGQVR